MSGCAFCGQPVGVNEKHTHEDCLTWLKDHPEGGPLFEKLGGMSNVWGKARKKPIEIQYREIIPQWLDEDESGQWCEKVHTHEGVLWAYQEEDFIIKGVEGELYPIKKHIFEKTYDVTKTALTHDKRRDES